jgi:hypothetical protein
MYASAITKCVFFVKILKERPDARRSFLFLLMVVYHPNVSSGLGSGGEVLSTAS